MSIELSKALNSDLYPDLQRVDGLGAALQRVLYELKTDLIVQQPDTPYLCAVVHRAERSAQVKVAARERAFPVDFWNQGVQYGCGLVGALDDVGRGIVAFHAHGASLNEMEARFHWFKANGRGFAHEGGPERFLTEAWQNLQERLKNDIEDPPGYQLRALVAEATRRPKLRQLLPFRSLYRLCFSRTTGYPYTRDCPLAHPIEGGRFRVISPDEKKILGEGDAVRAVDLVVANLPQDCGPAIHGTAKTV